MLQNKLHVFLLPTRRAIWYRVNKYVTLHFSRLQNSPYFYLFKYAPAVKQKVWNEAENRERDWGETARRARLLRHTLPISLLILRKNRLFAVYLFRDPSGVGSLCYRNSAEITVL